MTAVWVQFNQCIVSSAKFTSPLLMMADHRVDTREDNELALSAVPADPKNVQELVQYVGEKLLSTL